MCEIFRITKEKEDKNEEYLKRLEEKEDEDLQNKMDCCLIRERIVAAW